MRTAALVVSQLDGIRAVLALAAIRSPPFAAIDGFHDAG
jgi:hypothetical protein